MSIVGYKQNTEIFNTKPVLKGIIDQVSELTTCRYYPEKPMAKTKEELLARPERYSFQIILREDNSHRGFRYVYYFDDKKKAILFHKEAKIRHYDQMTRPFLNKITKGKKLSYYDKLRIHEVVNSF